MPKDEIKKEYPISERVMRQIHERRITMRSRWYFLIGTIALSIGLAAAILVACFFFSVVFFRLHSYGHMGYLRFGQFGWRALWGSFPWSALIIAILGLSSGILLLRKFDISYRRNYLYITTGIAIITITTSLLVGIFGLHAVPGLTHYLHRNQSIGSHWVVGEILAVNEKTLEVQTPTGETIHIIWDDKTLLPQGGRFIPGQRARAVGEWEDGKFYAHGIGRGGMHWRNQNTRERRNMMMQ